MDRHIFMIGAGGGGAGGGTSQFQDPLVVAEEEVDHGSYREIRSIQHKEVQDPEQGRSKWYWGGGGRPAGAGASITLMVVLVFNCLQFLEIPLNS